MSLWRDHLATPHQQTPSFCPSHKQPTCATQADLLIGMLRDARTKGEPLQLPEIMKAGIAQHDARFKEIRDRGFQFENEMERSGEGVIFSHSWLRYDPEMDGGAQ
jgi:hypothetical protein